jgi:hypothetical protein
MAEIGLTVTTFGEIPQTFLEAPAKASAEKIL